MAPMIKECAPRKSRNRINLRLSPEVFELIDAVRTSRAGVISRNTWISEAIREKLDRDLEAVSSFENAQDRKDA